MPFSPHVLLALAISFLLSLCPTASLSQPWQTEVCDTVFVRPSYPTRKFFCSVGEMVADAYDPEASYRCEEMEVDHFISLRYAHRNGVCEFSQLKALANDPNNLKLTLRSTNRSKAAMSPEEFAVRRLSGSESDAAIQFARELRKQHGLRPLVLSSRLKVQWLEDETRRLQRDNTKLRRQNLELKQAARFLKNASVTYRGKKMSAANAVSHHTSRMSRLTSRSAVRNVGSMAAEGLPFVGIAAIVGVTGWEVKDACDALKENYELNIAFNPSEAISEDMQTVCSLEIPSRAEILAAITSSPQQAWQNAKEFVPSLPETSDLEIDWNGYMSTAKSGAVWLMEETGGSISDIASAAKKSWASFVMDSFWTFGK